MKITKLLIQIVSDGQTRFDITPEQMAKQIQRHAASVVAANTSGTLPMVTVTREELPADCGKVCRCGNTNCDGK